MGIFLVTFYLTCRFVHMDSESASQEAIRNLNGKHDFHGRKMKVRSRFAIALNWWKMSIWGGTEWQQGAEQAKHPEAFCGQHCWRHHWWWAQVKALDTYIIVRLNQTMLPFYNLFWYFSRSRYFRNIRIFLRSLLLPIDLLLLRILSACCFMSRLCFPTNPSLKIKVVFLPFRTIY